MTLESSPMWANLIGQTLRRKGLWIDENFRLVVEDFYAAGAEAIIRFVKAVETDASWNIILVDGEELPGATRVDCVEAAKNRVADDGILILDDAWREEYRTVPEILSGWKRLEFWGLGPNRLGVTKTDIYINARPDLA